VSDKTFEGKVLVIYVKSHFQTPPMALRNCAFENQSGRSFVCGVGLSTLPAHLDPFAGRRRCIAWDAVESYLICDSVEDYMELVKRSMSPPSGYEIASSNVDIPGAPVEPSGIEISDDTELEVGMKVLANWSGKWWRAEILAKESRGRVRVHFVGWDSMWDQSMARNDLQVDLADSANAS
jgi:hypothetical protein